MKIILCAILVLLVTSTANADYKEWTKADTGMQLLFTALLEVDRQQTNWIIANPYFGGTFHRETNPIIGEDASPARVNTYFAACAVGHAIVAYYIPVVVKAVTGNDDIAKYSRTLWQSTWIAVQSSVVDHNYSVGVRTEF